MRAIEKNILDTLNAGKTGSFSLSIRDCVNISENYKEVKLWGNLIFWTEKNGFGFSFCGYSTNTTKSRLNAIFNYFNLGGFYQKNYIVYWVNNGSIKIEVDTNKKYKIVFLDNHAVKIEAVN